ncbi:uncharacterized protein BJ212DRAFT_1531173 [Suillus subaureus]|uniref:Uncharacterized protein n=1 Tax=Suillus subaureus TaxID=48587 RepID=A0A9P7E172_9AGAM|nr:uncharacterized protein BJ212DRAFT_1531173 [Suillus subaureus]KAG1808181.1 hypothetical protein BJ212DRAFT_1531173 [Suillus subaureus]
MRSPTMSVQWTPEFLAYLQGISTLRWQIGEIGDNINAAEEPFAQGRNSQHGWHSDLRDVERVATDRDSCGNHGSQPCKERQWSVVRRFANTQRRLINAEIVGYPFRISVTCVLADPMVAHTSQVLGINGRDKDLSIFQWLLIIDYHLRNFDVQLWSMENQWKTTGKPVRNTRATYSLRLTGQISDLIQTVACHHKYAVTSGIVVQALQGTIV